MSPIVARSYARPTGPQEVGMPLYEFDGRAPKVHATAFVAPTATRVGEVIVEEGASPQRHRQLVRPVSTG